MMAEKTDINVPEKTRQSKDYTSNFSPEETSDSKILHPACSRTEFENINEKQEKCSAGWDKGTDDMLLRTDSISSIHSCDSGYASRKCTGNSIFYNFGNEEEK